MRTKIFILCLAVIGLFGACNFQQQDKEEADKGVVLHNAVYRLSGLRVMRSL